MNIHFHIESRQEPWLYIFMKKRGDNKMKYSRKCLIKYRFKDSMGYVFFRTFRTDHEARLWYERNKVGYSIKEFSSMGITYEPRQFNTSIT